MKFDFIFAKTTLFLTYYICFVVLNTGCYCKDIKSTPSDPTAVFEDTLHTLKEKVKESGIRKPEDVPLVSEWAEKCKKTVSGRTWRVIRNSPKRLMECISNHIKFDKLKLEIEDSTARGDLDLVFKKYCGRREQILECIDETLEVVKLCLDDQQLIDLNISRNAVDAGVDFICHENGDRIALFMAEKGIQCLKNASNNIKECVETNIPEVKEAEEDPKSMELDKFLINDKNCKKISVAHQCVVKATISCDDPTPSNILDSLITEALKVTPCSQTKTDALSASNSFYLHFYGFLPHFLILILSGLTAAHILL